MITLRDPASLIIKVSEFDFEQIVILVDDEDMDKAMKIIQEVSLEDIKKKSFDSLQDSICDILHEHHILCDYTDNWGTISIKNVILK